MPAFENGAGTRVAGSLERVAGRLTQINNRWLITPKLMYFTMNTVVYTFHLFRAPFITEYLDLSKPYVGLISTLMSVIAFPSATVWSTLADRLGRHKLVLSLITFGVVACFELLLVRFEAYHVRLMYSIGMLMLYNSFLVGMQPLLDYAALELLSSKPGFSKEMYGRQRLWGTIAYSVITLGGAVLMDWLGGFWVLFMIMPLVAVVFVATLYFTALPDKPKALWGWRGTGPGADGAAEQGAKGARGSPEITAVQLSGMAEAKGAGSVPHLVAEGAPGGKEPGQKQQRGRWRALLTDPNYMFFLFVILMLGLARSVMTTYLALFWKTNMQMTSTEIACAGAIFAMVLEIGVFFVARPVGALLGNYWMLLLAQLAMVVRCWAYVWLPEGRGLCWAVYVIELLKGLSFGLAHSAAIKIANEAAPEGLEATAQALYNSVYVQLPTAIAGLIGMWAFGRFHNAAAKVMFLGTAVLSSLALVLFVLKYGMDGKIRIRLWARGAVRGA